MNREEMLRLSSLITNSKKNREVVSLLFQEYKEAKERGESQELGQMYFNEIWRAIRGSKASLGGALSDLVRYNVILNRSSTKVIDGQKKYVRYYKINPNSKIVELLELLEKTGLLQSRGGE